MATFSYDRMCFFEEGDKEGDYYSINLWISHRNVKQIKMTNVLRRLRKRILNYGLFTIRVVKSSAFFTRTPLTAHDVFHNRIDDRFVRAEYEWLSTTMSSSVWEFVCIVVDAISLSKVLKKLRFMGFDQYLLRNGYSKWFNNSREKIKIEKYLIE